MNQNEKIIQKLNVIIILVGLMSFFLAGTYISTRIMLETIQSNMDQTSHKLLKISLKLDMVEKARPTGKEVIYLDEDLQDCLNNDLITGGC